MASCRTQESKKKARQMRVETIAHLRRRRHLSGKEARRRVENCDCCGVQVKSSGGGELNSSLKNAVHHHHRVGPVAWTILTLSLHKTLSSMVL